MAALLRTREKSTEASVGVESQEDDGAAHDIHPVQPNHATKATWRGEKLHTEKYYMVSCACWGQPFSQQSFDQTLACMVFKFFTTMHLLTSASLFRNILRARTFQLCLTRPTPLALRHETFPCSHTSRTSHRAKIHSRSSLVSAIFQCLSHVTQDQVQTGISAMGRKTLKACCSRWGTLKSCCRGRSFAVMRTQLCITYFAQKWSTLISPPPPSQHTPVNTHLSPYTPIWIPSPQVHILCGYRHLSFCCWHTPFVTNSSSKVSILHDNWYLSVSQSTHICHHRLLPESLH